MGSHEFNIIFFIKIIGYLFYKKRSSFIDRSCAIYYMHTILLSKNVISLYDFCLKFFEAFDDIIWITYIHTRFIVLKRISSYSSLSCDIYRNTEIKSKIRNREVRIIKWLQVLHFYTTSIASSESCIHITITQYYHTCSKCSTHLGKISFNKIRCIYSIEYCSRHIQVFLLQLLLHFMNLDWWIPDTVNAEKTIRFEKILGYEKLCRFSWTIGSFYDYERPWSFLSWKEYFFFRRIGA